jgi:hypothetical protein
LGYLVTVEQIGRTLQPRGTKNPRSRDGKSREVFVSAASEFGDPLIDRRSREMLYEVRCALAHEYGLTGKKTEFVYARGGPLIQLPPNKFNVPIISVDKVWEYVEALVAKVRSEHTLGNVMPLTNVTAADLLKMRFVVT